MRIDFMLVISFQSFGIRFVRMGPLGFSCVLGFNKSLQIGEAHFPEVPVLIEPGIDGAKRFGIELVNPVAAFAMFTDEMGAAQQAQVLGDGGTGDGKGSGNVSRGLAAAAQQIEHGAAGRVGQSLEGRLG
jgi:hypothetical protein